MEGISEFADIPTADNSRGVHAVSQEGKDFCVATCHEKIGCVEVNWYRKDNEVQSNIMDAKALE